MALGKARLGQLFYAEGMRSDYDCLHMACAALLSLSWASKRLAIIIGAVSFCSFIFAIILTALSQYYHISVLSRKRFTSGSKVLDVNDIVLKLNDRGEEHLTYTMIFWN